MDVFVISLPNALERRKHMEAMLHRFGIDFEWFDGIDPSLLSDNIPNNYLAKFSNTSLSNGEIGCILSHIGVWKLISERNISNALILEDDVYLNKSITTIINKTKNLVGSYILKIETIKATVTLKRKSFILGDRFSFHELLTNHGGAAGYIISRECAHQLVKQTPNIRLAIDVEIFDPGRRNIDVPVIYQCIPAACIQDMFRDKKSQKAALESQIGGDRRRQDHHTSQPSMREKSIQTFKCLLRPVYTECYDFLLFWRGLRRLKVRYSDE